MVVISLLLFGHPHHMSTGADRKKKTTRKGRLRRMRVAVKRTLSNLDADGNPERRVAVRFNCPQSGGSRTLVELTTIYSEHVTLHNVLDLAFRVSREKWPGLDHDDRLQPAMLSYMGADGVMVVNERHNWLDRATPGSDGIINDGGNRSVLDLVKGSFLYIVT